MHVSPGPRGELAEFSNDECSALVRALEVGRAVLRRDTSLDPLAAEDTVSVEALDALADRLFLVGTPSATE